MLFNIDPAEFVLLLVLGIIVFGPEKLPAFSRKAARVFVYLRDVANNAQTQLRSELGPEFSDLEIKDLNPKAFVAKHMKAEIEAIEAARQDLVAAKKSLDDAARLVGKETQDAAEIAQGEDTAGDEAAITAPAATQAVAAPAAPKAALTGTAELLWDPEAT